MAFSPVAFSAATFPPAPAAPPTHSLPPQLPFRLMDYFSGNPPGPQEEIRPPVTEAYGALFFYFITTGWVMLFV